MSDGTNRTYTQEVTHFSDMVENLTSELRSFKKEIGGKIDRMSSQVEKNRLDADNLTEGNKRHGIEPVRKIANYAKTKSDESHHRLDDIEPIAKDALRIATKANNRISRLLWTVSGAAGGGGVGGAYIFELIKSLS